jgi:hypothetical protein
MKRVFLSALTAPESRTSGVARETVDSYKDILSDTLLGVFESYTALEREPVLRDHFVWMPTRLPYSSIPRRKPAGAYKNLEKILKEETTRPLFIPFHVNKGHMSYRHAVELAQRLETDFPGQTRITTPDEFLLLYRLAMGSRSGPQAER